MTVPAEVLPEADGPAELRAVPPARALRIGSACSGYEGLGLGAAGVLGGTLAWVADNNPGAAAILAHRFPDVANLGDITKVDWAEVEPVDVLIAGFPCQDISCAGARAGVRHGNRSGLWYWIVEAILVLRPKLIIIENVGAIRSAWADSDVEFCPWCLGERDAEHAVRALGAVLGSLAEAGFDAEGTSIRASDAGACHRRERVFIAAWPAADAERGELQRRGIPGVLGGPQGAEPGPRGERERDGHPVDRSGADAKDALLKTPTAQLAVNGGPQHPDKRRAGGHGPTLEDQAVFSLSASGGQVDWGIYEAAVRRWEAVFGRPVPCPTEPGERGGRRLSAYFVEWMMGLPDGWVTGVPGLSRTQMLHALGNGVVPQQADLAIRWLLSLAWAELPGVITEALAAAA